MSIIRGNNIIAGVPIVDGTMSTTSTRPLQNKVITNAFNDLSNRVDQIIGGQVYTKTETDALLNDKADKSDTYTKTEINNLFQTLYPVGSLYIGTQSTCPLATIISGSTWELVGQDKTLQGSSSGHSANTTINAGLPNITGNIGYTARGSTSGQMTALSQYATLSTIPRSGAFNYDSVTSDGADYTSGGGASLMTSGFRLLFNASLSNSIYGSSTTVQPPAYVVNVWRRTQ